MVKLTIVVVTFFFAILISAIAVLPLEVYIIRDISKLYGVQFILNLPREVIFGSLLIISLLKIDTKELFHDRNKADDDDEYGIVASIQTILKGAVFVIILLISWWIAYVIHAVNHF